MGNNVKFFVYEKSLQFIPKKKTSILNNKSTYRSLSSAACEASESLAVAEPKRSSERSRSSSKSWIRRFKAATSDSAYVGQEMGWSDVSYLANCRSIH